MNLEKLFETQKVLRDRIAYNEPDRFNKLVLALLVELGECANEWRGFKFWSVNQIPHISAVRTPCMMEEDKEFYNPLLEEYVDGLHFVLELALEIESEWHWDRDEMLHEIDTIKKHEAIESENVGVTELFTTCYFYAVNDYNEWFCYLFAYYIILGKRLGFTWEQIEQAYFAKNAINHERQNNGY
jgi:dimeric dUTPase (all-alpha-NTP-PPase superfamily)